jgi:hypothetical protein
MDVAAHAMDEHELVDGPADRIDRVFLDVVRVV